MQQHFQRNKKEHIIQGAFYTYFIDKIQEYLPEKFFIINCNYEADLAKAIKKRELILLDRSALKFPEKSAEIFLDLEEADQPGHEDEMG